MEGYIFSMIEKVRDYECDMQGVVNNANYQHYLEHTRHEFISSLGESFSKWTEIGRASCRERGWQDVLTAAGAGS